jgi:Putative silver efflux pump
VRLARAFRDEIEDLKNLEIITPSGAITTLTTLGNVADVVVFDAPSEIRNEDGFVAFRLYYTKRRGGSGKGRGESKGEAENINLI